eukprot:2092724-Pyramimonas_sp.AAC.1
MALPRRLGNAAFASEHLHDVHAVAANAVGLPDVLDVVDQVSRSTGGMLHHWLERPSQPVRGEHRLKGKGAARDL